MPIDLEFLVVANAKLQIFGDLPKGLSPFLSAQFNFLSDTNIIIYKIHYNLRPKLDIANDSVFHMFQTLSTDIHSTYGRVKLKNIQLF